MITGREFVDQYYEEKLYSTGDDYLDEMLEKAFCEGYEYAQKEYGKISDGIFKLTGFNDAKEYENYKPEKGEDIFGNAKKTIKTTGQKTKGAIKTAGQRMKSFLFKRKQLVPAFVKV